MAIGLSTDQIAQLDAMCPASALAGGLGALINTLDGNTDEANAAKIGTLASLSTTDKTDLVTAINEVLGIANGAEESTAIGTLASLTTTEKSNLVGALNEVRAALVSETDGASGADFVGITPITAFGAADTVQEVLEAIDAKLAAETDSSSGADYVAITPITELGAADTVQEGLEALSAGKVAGSAISILVQNLPGVLLNQKIINGWVPGFAGKIAKVTFCVGQTPASTPGADIDLTVSIGAVAVTDGVLTLTTAACDAIGKVASVTPSAANAFSATDAISIECTEVAQAFAEGWGTLILTLAPA